MHRRLLVLPLLLALALGLIGPVRSDAAPPGVAARATAFASSTGSGSAPRNLIDTGSTSAAGSSWQSEAQVAGAYVRLVWPSRTTVRAVQLVQTADPASRIRAGMLTFSDGSAVMVALRPSGVTTVPVTARRVKSMRFTVTAAAPGARSVSLAEVLVRSTPAATDVVTTRTVDGDLAPSGRPDSSTGSARAINDGTGKSVGAVWSTPTATTAWVRISWDRPRELSSVQIVGAPGTTSTVTAGKLTFSDGSTLPVGGIVAASDQASTVAFTPRVTTSVRFTVTAANGNGRLALAELRAFQVGSTPTVLRPTKGSVATSPKCGGPVAAATRGVVVTCPLAGTTVGSSTTLTVDTSAPVTATVWPADPAAKAAVIATAKPTTSGHARVRLDLSEVAPGPFTVMIKSSKSPEIYLQLFRSGTKAPRTVGSSWPARGKTLSYAEEFNRPVSTSRDGRGATYATGKPNRGGAEDFGDAIFADPSAGLDNLGTTDGGYLRMVTKPKPTGYQDPGGYGRTRIGAMLSSARGGGSGFSAQYGYFEARILAPAAPGTWPAFWMLPNPVLDRDLVPSTEIDAVELYGHDPEGGCATTHRYTGSSDDGITTCAQRFASTRTALGWHTYGVRVGPGVITYLVDGVQVAEHQQVTAADQPLFFMINLALGGGWPIDVNGTNGQAAMYVDYVRVYT